MDEPSHKLSAIEQESPADRVRQAEKIGRMRYVLGISLGLAIIAMAIIWFSYNEIG